MKKILKTIAFGMILGTALFFVPFIFKFLLVVMVIGLMFKLISGGRRRRHFMNRFEEFGYHPAQVIPIDNQWYKPTIQGNGPVNYININY